MAKGGGLKGRLGAVLAAGLVLVAGAAGGAGYLLLTGAKDASEAKAPDERPRPDTIYHQDVPQMIVGLDGEGHDRLQIQVTLEVASQDGKSAVKRRNPHIMDSFRQHLSELDAEALDRKDSAKHLREELLKRARDAVSDAEIHGLLFRKLLVI